MTTATILFWTALVLVFYTYLGYGMLLRVLVGLKRMLGGQRRDTAAPVRKDLPQLTLMICAYNEEDVVDEKMRNTLQLDYPKDRLTVMWVTDGSTDSTNERLAKYDGVKVVYSPERAGKAAAIAHGISENSAPFVVFTDANTMLNSEALQIIARTFADPTVGCVSGEKRVAGRVGQEQVASQGEGLYWRYESLLKRWDSELYSAMGAAGELFAVRMSCYEAPPSNALLDDFMMSMLILKKGYRIAYTPDAYATEYGSADMIEESKRKRRIAAGGLQSSWWLRAMMNPFRYPKVALQFVSHRVLRWTITPIALVALPIINAWMVMHGSSAFYWVTLALMVLFAAAALAGYVLSLRGTKNRWLYVPYYFLFMNLNVFIGAHYFITHRKRGTWEKARRG